MSRGLRFGVVLAALAMAGTGAARAADGGARATGKAVPRLALTAADMTPFAARPPGLATAAVPGAARPLAAFFDARFADPARRAERCRNLPKVRPPDYYSVHPEQSGLQTFGGIRIPFRPWAAHDVMPHAGARIDESVNVYLLCLQNSPY